MRGFTAWGSPGDTLNTAWYMRALTRAEDMTVDYATAVGTDQLVDKNAGLSEGQ